MVVNTKLYDVLEIPTDADDATMKRAHRRLVRLHHPDKGGDAEKFKEVDAAYKVLSNPDLRQQYDLSGSIDGNNAQQVDPDILNNLFRGMFSQFNQTRSTPDMIHQLAVPLEQFYTGKTRTLSITRTCVCKTCQGKGGEKCNTCNNCKGTGSVTSNVQHGPFLMQNISPCPLCKSKGNIVDPTTICNQCQGEGTHRVKSNVQINIAKGTPNGCTIVVKNMADERLDHVTGNLIFVLYEQPHATFSRQGQDLILNQDIDLVKALVGGTIKVTHLDPENPILLVKLQKGRVIKPNDALVIDNKGMPIQGQEATYGNLIIKFNIKFPSNEWSTNVDKKMVQQLLREDAL